jgi:hypothetical protein
MCDVPHIQTRKHLKVNLDKIVEKLYQTFQNKRDPVSIQLAFL